MTLEQRALENCKQNTIIEEMNKWCQAIQEVCPNKMCAGEFSSQSGKEAYLRASFLIDSEQNPAFKEGKSLGYEDGRLDGYQDGFQDGSMTERENRS